MAQSRRRILHRSATLSTVYFSLLPSPEIAEKLTGLLPVSRRAFYSESLSCQSLSEEFFQLNFFSAFKQLLPQEAPVSVACPSKERRILQTCSEVSTVRYNFFGTSTMYRQNSVFTAAAARVAFSLASAIELPVARATPIRRRPLSSGLPNSLRKISGSANAFSSPE